MLFRSGGSGKDGSSNDNDGGEGGRDGGGKNKIFISENMKVRIFFLLSLFLEIMKVTLKKVEIKIVVSNMFLCSRFP